MKTFTAYGCSDDLIELDGIEGADEFGAYAADKTAFNLGSQMKIYAIYDGCWHFSIGQIEEDIPLPDWPIRFSTYKSGYSVFLEIDVPDNTTISRIIE